MSLFRFKQPHVVKTAIDVKSTTLVLAVLAFLFITNSSTAHSSLASLGLNFLICEVKIAKPFSVLRTA